MTEPKQTCNTCGGSGEICFFQGESRFFITREECPACCGFGFVLEDEESGGTTHTSATENNVKEGEGEG